MGLVRRGFWSVGISVLIFFGVSHSWAHAALVQAVSGAECPPDLEAEARRTVMAYYGEVKASPIIACLQGPVLGLQVNYGTTRFAPFMPPIIILGPQGQNIDVASHEFSHAELADRTSPLLRTFRIPTWFDEGVGMQLDHRAPFSEKALQGYLKNGVKPNLTLSQLSRPKDFFRSGEDGKIHYAFSKCVIHRWIAKEGRQGLDDVISGIGWFSKFPTSQFETYETECLTVSS